MDTVVSLYFEDVDYIIHIFKHWNVSPEKQSTSCFVLFSFLSFDPLPRGRSYCTVKGSRFLLMHVTDGREGRV